MWKFLSRNSLVGNSSEGEDLFCSSCSSPAEWDSEMLVVMFVAQYKVGSAMSGGWYKNNCCRCKTELVADRQALSVLRMRRKWRGGQGGTLQKGYMFQP